MNNNKNTNRSTSKDKDESEARVFARSISRSEMKKVAGGKTVCVGTGPNAKGEVQLDCIWE